VGVATCSEPGMGGLQFIIMRVRSSVIPCVSGAGRTLGEGQWHLRTNRPARGPHFPLLTGGALGTLKATLPVPQAPVRPDPHVLTIPSMIDDLLPHMRRVVAADRELHDLSLIWTMIEATSAISCPEEAESVLPTLVQTREAFAELHRRLVNRLGQENLAELQDELSSTAQCAIDILVRNLYERTADVGFLATDDVLQQYCALGADARTAERPAVQRRLAEYRDKYTVYDDIVLLSPAGDVLARLDDSHALQRSTDTIVDEALAAQGYVQRYGATDLACDEQAALLYAHRISGAQGRCLGVLVLRFRLADEMQRIFDSVSLEGRELAVVLVDGQGRVVVSNDTSHIPLGARIQRSPDQQLAVSAFAGREYLGVTCPTRGYQGYMGLGWQAHAMVSLLTAFHQRETAHGIQQGVALDNPELHRIQADVDAINRNLRRVVWNGRLSASTRQGNMLRLKAVLQQVNAAGERMRERVGRAIQDLYRASLGRAHHQAADLARLAADIMDRNLYERANDCRWWALSPLMQRVLAGPAQPQGTEALNAMLAHVNSLYTVYTRLVAFDARGQIRGVSRDTTTATLLGTSIDPSMLHATLQLSHSQAYAVSPFAAGELSEGVPSYVYLAAVRCPQTQRAVGGIAIVFNAQDEFRAMLADVLGDRPGVAAFVDQAGRFIASTDPSHQPGQPCTLKTDGNTIEYQDANWALARVKAGGYREFNISSGYQHGVSAVVALRLGALERRQSSLHDRRMRSDATPGRGPTRELAVFNVGASRYALPTQAVRAALEATTLVRMPVGASPVIGLLDAGTQVRPEMIPVLCARQLFGVDYPARTDDGVVVVITDEQHRERALCGLRVDDVLGVVDVAQTSIQPAPEGLRSAAPYLGGVVQLETALADRQPLMAQLLLAPVLAGLVKGRSTAGTASAAPVWVTDTSEQSPSVSSSMSA
jgi:chemotaxis signal transduction protein